MNASSLRFRWDELGSVAGSGGVRVRVPVELGALTSSERELLVVRLRRRCGVARVEIVDHDGASAIELGLPADGLTVEVQRIADGALASVARDAAAGWTAQDEAELPSLRRHPGRPA